MLHVFGQYLSLDLIQLMNVSKKNRMNIPETMLFPNFLSKNLERAIEIPKICIEQMFLIKFEKFNNILKLMKLKSSLEMYKTKNLYQYIRKEICILHINEFQKKNKNSQNSRPS